MEHGRRQGAEGKESRPTAPVPARVPPVSFQSQLCPWAGEELPGAADLPLVPPARPGPRAEGGTRPHVTPGWARPPPTSASNNKAGRSHGSLPPGLPPVASPPPPLRGVQRAQVPVPIKASSAPAAQASPPPTSRRPRAPARRTEGTACLLNALRREGWGSEGHGFRATGSAGGRGGCLPSPGRCCWGHLPGR